MEQQKQLHLIMEWDLQWFAKDGPGGEKTEPATAKKLREAREDGKVVKSKELSRSAYVRCTDTDSDCLCSLFCIWICCDGADQCDPGWVESDRETVAAQIR